MHRHLAFALQSKPGVFGGNPAPAARAGRPQLRMLVHPTAVAIAIDAGRREITEPGKVRDRRDVVAMAVEYRIAGLVRRYRDQDVRDAGEHRPVKGAIAVEAQPAETRTR